MKSKVTKTIIILVVFIVCLLIAGWAGFLIGYGDACDLVFQEPKRSPSGNYICEQMYGYSRAKFLSIVIKPYNKSGEVKEYTLEERFYIRHETIVEWGEDDKLWVYSSDIGTYYWEIDAGQWVKRAAVETALDNAPEEIAEKW